MIDIALVSGRDDRAFFYENSAWHSLSSSGKTTSSPREVREAVNGTGEYRVLSDSAEAQLIQSLEREKRQADALFLTLATMDVDISISTRVLLAQQAELYLTDPETKDFVLSRILSWPLPTNVSASRHSLMQVANNFDVVGMTLKEIFDSQPLIQEIIHLWEESCRKVGIELNPTATFRSELIDSRFFVSVLRGCATKDASHVNTTIVSELLRPSIPTDRKAALLDFQKILGNSSILGGSRREKAQGRLFKRTFGLQPIVSKYESFRPLAQDLSKSSQSIRKVGSFEAKGRVDRQIAAIKNTLFSDKLPMAERYIRELMTFQLGREEQQYAVMSLCNVAKSALDAYQFDFAGALAQYAVELGPDDPVAFTTRAEVFRLRGQFASALAAYDETIHRFAKHPYALNGKAEVLKEMGRFEEATNVFLEAQAEFPDNSVAFNGQVGVLKSAGKYREAVKLAVSVTRRFPFDAISRGVLASALSGAGKYSDAVHQYRQALNLDSSNIRLALGTAFAMRYAGLPEAALNFLDQMLIKLGSHETAILQAKAQILRSLGRYSEARKLYIRIQEVSPKYAPARWGLLALDALESPLASIVYDGPIDELGSEQDWIGFRSLMVALIAVGRVAEAIQEIEKALPNCMWRQEKSRLLTVLGMAQIRNRDSNSIETLQANLDSLDDRQKQTRLLILSHAHIEQNNPTIAKVLLRFVTTRDREMQTLKRGLVELTLNADNFATPQELFPTELNLAMAA